MIVEHVARTFFIAWHFLTAIPLSRLHHDPTPRELALSMGWFPAIGLILGGLLAATDLLLADLFARHVVDVLLILLLVLMTGGLHQDGLADTMDGLAGGHTPAERLTIMRDARIGAIGATALVLALGFKYAALAAVPQAERAPLLICMPAVGRWAMVVGAISAHYARPEGGLAEPFLQHLSRMMLILATVMLVGAAWWLIGPIGTVIGLSLTVLTARAVTALCNRLCGGITGDTLGATNELTETLFLLSAPALLSLR